MSPRNGIITLRFKEQDNFPDRRISPFSEGEVAGWEVKARVGIPSQTRERAMIKKKKRKLFFFGGLGGGVLVHIN
jgi:hypothetical protein